MHLLFKELNFITIVSKVSTENKTNNTSNWINSKQGPCYKGKDHTVKRVKMDSSMYKMFIKAVISSRHGLNSG